MSDNHNQAATDAEQPRNWLDACITWVGDLLSLFFIFTVAISFYEVVMRYVFNAPTLWVHESASFIGGMLFVFGGLYAFATNKHVRVVLIYDAVSARARQWLNLFHHLAGLAFAAMMVWASYSMAEAAWFTPWGELRLETSGSAWNPPFPALLKGFIFISMCFLAIQFLLHLISEINGLRKEKDV